MVRVQNVIVSVGAAAGAALAQTITGLGTFSGSFDHSPRGVADAGAVVVGQGWASGTFVPWRWTPGVGTEPLGYNGYAMAVSRDGLVIVGQRGVLTGDAVMWTASGGEQGLGWASPTHDRSRALGVSADGSVVAGYSALGTSAASTAFRWTRLSGMVGLGFLPGHTHSIGNGISADGSVVVGSSYYYPPGGGYPQEAFRWTQAGGMVGLGFLPGRNSSTGAAVSADGGTVVGGSYTPNIAGVEPFRWTSGGIQTLGMLAGFNTCSAVSVNSDGSIIVGWCVESAYEGFIWTQAAGIRPMGAALASDYGLNLGGWELRLPFAISSDGRAIVGAGINPQGVPEPFLIVLPALCYANCDASTTAPVLNVADFTCFLNRFASSDSRANCDSSTTAPVLNIADFTCFLNRFAAGCS